MRIAIIGNSGSGKSTLAHKLCAGQSMDTLDLDTIAWEPNQIAVARNADLALSDLHEFCRAREEWIVEGCYANLVGASLVYKPELIFLNPGLERCLANCRSRPWEEHKFESKAAQDAKLKFLLDWVAEYYSRAGEMSFACHQDLFERYSGPKRMLTSTDEFPPNNDAL